MAQLGEMLMERGWVTPEQLRLGRRRQNELGGRIGTCLLEVGALSEDLLLRCLSEQAGVPRVPIRDLHSVPKEVSSLLTPEKAHQYRAVPFRQFGGQIEVALEEVSDLSGQDEISFLLGKRVNIHIANEVRIAEALENIYGLPSSARFKQLLSRLNRSREFHKGGSGGPVPNRAPAVVTTVPEPRLAPPRLPHAPSAPTAVPSGPALTSEAVQSALGKGFKTQPIRISGIRGSQGRQATAVAEKPAAVATAPVGVTAPVTAPTQTSPSPSVHEDSGQDLVKSEAEITPEGSSPKTNVQLSEAPIQPTSFEERLIDANSPDDLGALLIEELSIPFDRVVLFHLVEGSIRGWMARGPDLDLDRLQRYTCPLAIPSVFLTLEQGGGFFLGRLPTLPAHRRLASFLESGSRTQTLFVPVRLNGRLVCILFTDRAAGSFSTQEVERIRRVAAQAELAFKRIILREKILAIGSAEAPTAPQN